MEDLTNETELLEEEYGGRETYLELHDILQMTFPFIGMIGDLLIILTIMLFNNMKTTRNYIILNWAIADFIFMIFEPRKFFLLASKEIISYDVFIIIVYIFLFFHMFSCVIVFILSVDVIYKRITLEKVKIIFYLAWSTFIVILLLSIKLNSIIYRLDLMLYLCMVLILTVFLFVQMTCFVIKKMEGRSLHTNLRFLLALVYILCYLTIGLIEALFIFGVYDRFIQIFQNYFVIVPYSTSLFNLGLICYFDNAFKMNFCKMFKRESQPNINNKSRNEENVFADVGSIAFN